MNRGGSLAILMISAVVPTAGHAYTFRAEKTYHRSLALLKDGQYERALEGFMDVLLEDPEFPGAKESLRKAARESVKRERTSIIEERDSLMEEIRGLTGPKEGAPKDSAVASWKEAVDTAISLVSEPADLEKAFRAYAKAIERTPISFRAMQSLASARTGIQKKVFDLYPAMAEEPQWKGKWPGSMKTGALVEAVLMEQANTMAWSDAEKDMVRQPARPETSAKIRKLASSIDATEKAKSELLWTATQAFHHMRKERFQESSGFWRKVLESDPGNEEAKLYLSRVEKAVAQASPKAVSAYARARKDEPIAWPSGSEEAAEGTPAPEPARSKSNRPAKPKPAPAPPAAAPQPEPPERVPPKGPAAVDPAVMREWGQDLYRRGLKSYSLGKLDEAIEYWNNCLGVDPDHPKARKALERAMREKK
ncbi:MAG: hypothetical protein HZB91_08625 [Elusimicrobia bacterium]|nr:hypothetical protein [Elusimicrobiota bacterium]